MTSLASAEGAPYGREILARVGLFTGYLYRGKGEQPVIEPVRSRLKVAPQVVRAFGGRRVTDCSTFAGVGVVGGLPGEWYDGAASDLAVGDARDPYSPIAACSRARVGSAVDAPIPGRLHLVQVWREVDSAFRPVIASGGHAFLWYAIDADRGVKVHASSSAGRVLAEDQTWADQRKRYAGIRLSALAPVP